MADNPQKRAICNLALVIERAGVTAKAQQFFTEITDAHFADYTTITGDPSMSRMVFLYEDILKQVLIDIRPDFARQYADLSDVININMEHADYAMLFELPDNYLELIAQVDESDSKTEYDSEILTFDSYAHVVVGTDDQAYKCIVNVTASDDTKPITGTWSTNWELYNTDGSYGATWVEDWDYKAAASGHLLATNDYSNTDGDSAYIEYLAYVQAGISDKPEYYTQAFRQAFAVRLAAAYTKDKDNKLVLMARYEELAKPKAFTVEDARHYKGNRTKQTSALTARRNLGIS